MKSFCPRLGGAALILVLTGLVTCGPKDGDGPRPEGAWAAISAGEAHTCGVLADGSLWCWGRNTHGQLGDGTTDSRSRPVRVELPGRAVLVAAGGAHTCAGLEDGSLRCWGQNHRGQLGDGSTVQKTTPVTVSGLFGTVALAAGHAHSCAIDQAGGAWCWGANLRGQLGLGNVPSPEMCEGTFPEPCSLTPQPVADLDDVTAISAGGDADSGHSCAVTGDNVGWCWGDNDDRQLGDTTLVAHNAPAEVELTDVTGIAAGSRHSCGVLGDQTAWCWGQEFGDPFWISVLENVSAVTAGGGFSCALLADETLWCWGEGSDGQLGNGTAEDRVIPVQVAGLQGVAQFSAGGGHACAITTAGDAWCWGRNADGQVGGTSQLASPLPVLIR
jgi:alpha-tubulin suppressor-like RCC1 family protein